MCIRDSCSVSTLEQTKAVPKTINPEIITILASSRSIKKAEAGSRAVPCPATVVPRNPIIKINGNTSVAARIDPYLRASLSSEAHARCQFPCENISAEVIANTSARPDEKESM